MLLGNLSLERSPMTSAIRFGRVLGYAALALVRCWCLESGASFGGEMHDDGAASPTKVLTVCAIPASMPRTDKAPDGTPRGLDVAVAQQCGTHSGPDG